MTMLMNASYEWSNRAADERYGSLADIHAAATKRRDDAAVAVVDNTDLRAVEVAGDVKMMGKDKTASLTNWSFGQLSRAAGAPPNYMTKLSAPLAVECLNEGLEKNDNGTSSLLFNANGSLTARAITSEKYTRIWNADITERLTELSGRGWSPAPAAFDGSRGLYLGDRDMFCFLVDNERRIFESDPNGGLGRGFFAWNSEVGAKSFGIMKFMYEYVCGNHRVWGASEIVELRVRHVGNADQRGFSEWAATLSEYAESSAADDEAKIRSSKAYSFGATKDDVLDAIFKLRIPDLSKGMIDAGYEKAVEHEDWYGDPTTAWGIAGGITEVARDLPNADDRTKIDRAAGKVMEISF
jgi:hypothetical protein